MRQSYLGVCFLSEGHEELVKIMVRNQDFETERQIRAFSSGWLEWSKQLKIGGACNSTLDH